jgi:hypothetical protein
MVRPTMLLVSFLVCLVAVEALSSRQVSPRDTTHDAWVAASLKEMSSIKEGMTLTDLLKVFRLENPNGRTHIGGITTTFVSRACPYFKVDVVFSDMSPFEVITRISRPYVELPGVFD